MRWARKIAFNGLDKPSRLAKSSKNVYPNGMRTLLLVSFVVAYSCVAGAQETPREPDSQRGASSHFFNLSLVPKAQIYPVTDSVTGITLSFWGEIEQTSLALGIINGTRGHSAGLAIGGMNYGDHYTGVMLGGVNHTKVQFSGGQAGAINYAEGGMSGIQVGAVNYAGKMNGIQVGAINYAEQASGIQIGIGDFPSSVAPLMVVANWRF
jgi:hypothetical protein